MNSRELFERRDELKYVISQLRDELKDVEQNSMIHFLPKHVMLYAQTVKILAPHILLQVIVSGKLRQESCMGPKRTRLRLRGNARGRCTSLWQADTCC